eukprot:762915-Hanusia_phi.AAC.1
MEQGRSPALTISKVLLSVLSLLTDPNPNDPLHLSHCVLTVPLRRSQKPLTYTRRTSLSSTKLQLNGHASLRCRGSTGGRRRDPGAKREERRRRGEGYFDGGRYFMGGGSGGGKKYQKRFQFYLIAMKSLKLLSSYEATFRNPGHGDVARESTRLRQDELR